MQALGEGLFGPSKLGMRVESAGDPVHDTRAGGVATPERRGWRPTPAPIRNRDKPLRWRGTRLAESTGDSVRYNGEENGLRSAPAATGAGSGCGGDTARYTSRRSRLVTADATPAGRTARGQRPRLQGARSRGEVDWGESTLHGAPTERGGYKSDADNGARSPTSSPDGLGTAHATPETAGRAAVIGNRYYWWTRWDEGGSVAKVL